ncbi:MAG: hypothetical protein KF773_07765 [Deltaproteobacteria bacterium]|nr:hypothetical protein [Deltaproteobacteria bacterium]MCW5806116.1 hypothetical protein [Deltaproteobacteria bacterium]
MTKTSVCAFAFTALVAAAAGTARADKITCDPVAKKLEWHACVIGPVEYKRGMKTESRDECKVDKVVKPVDGCNFGDLTKHVPAEAAGDLASVRFYAIAPADFDDGPWEAQADPTGDFCQLRSAPGLDGWELMKFSEAFDKSNRERTELVTQKLKKAGKRIGQFGVTIGVGPQGCAGKSAKLGILDRKSLSKFLVYAEVAYTK